MNTKFMVVDYGMGNIKSIQNGFEVLGVTVEVTSDKKTLEQADAIIVPGVGAFADGMRNLKDRGLLKVIDQMVIRKKVPYLGICLGMQLVATLGKENRDCEGFGWIDAVVKRLQPDATLCRVPHIGWNDVSFKTKNDSVLANNLRDAESFYFVHSYHLSPGENEQKYVTGVTDHCEEVVAIIEKDNIFGVQFHPEKSQGAGLTVLKSFVDHVNNA